ncbi:MAG: SpoIID/LytB domain-containing protein [Clostridiales bacterium]|nr:SpoIID/LytB domain-containing protein [Clostridiales bacterium]
MRLRGWLILVCLLLLGTWIGTLGWRWISTEGRTADGSERVLSGAEDEREESEPAEDGTDGDRRKEENGETDDGGTVGVGENAVSGRILLERDGLQTYMAVEDYLPGVVACQIDTALEAEAMKCQAVIARTYIGRLMDGREEITEEELDLDYLGERTLAAADPVSREKLAASLELCEEAVCETDGIVMTYDRRCILPLFHKVSAGRTRAGESDYPYLKSVESRWDREAETYEREFSWTEKEFASLISQIPGGQPVDASQIPSQMQTVRKDAAGYIMQMKVGSSTYTGEEIQYALGLPSACFTFSGTEQEIRATVRGSGHGYGLSQAGADGMAREGWRWEDILHYYYAGISLEKK